MMDKMKKSNSIQQKFKMRYVLFVFMLCTMSACSSQLASMKSDPTIQSLINRNINHAAQQYRYLQSITPEDRFPKTYEHGKSFFSSARNWTSGFYPGSLVYLSEATGDEKFLQQAEGKLGYLEGQKDNKKTHDLGFMMYCSFGNAYRLTPKDAYKDILIQAAKSLATRYNPKVGSIQSWDRIKSTITGEYWDFPVIIDNMMNLELLFFASKVSGDPQYKDIAIKHAENVMKNHVRSNYSSYHVVVYNPNTGAVEKRETFQGYAHESTWARGQGWGIYGFTMVYRETGDKRFLKTAQGMADFFLNHKRLPEDYIPYWDFDASAEGFPSSWAYDHDKYATIPRDASAAALVASALIELAGISNSAKASKYLKAAEKLIQSLSSPIYTAKVGENGGFILKHGVGNMTKGTEVNVPLSYGDYYYLEAMLRYKKLNKE